MRSSAVALLAVLLLLPACGDDDSGSDPPPDVACEDLVHCDPGTHCEDAGPDISCYNLQQACDDYLCCTAEEACWLECGETDCPIGDSDPQVPVC
jgi:hypothetical protein